MFGARGSSENLQVRYLSGKCKCRTSPVEEKERKTFRHLPHRSCASQGLLTQRHTPSNRPSPTPSGFDWQASLLCPVGSHPRDSERALPALIPGEDEQWAGPHGAPSWAHGTEPAMTKQGCILGFCSEVAGSSPHAGPQALTGTEIQLNPRSLPHLLFCQRANNIMPFPSWARPTSPSHQKSFCRPSRLISNSSTGRETEA